MQYQSINFEYFSNLSVKKTPYYYRQNFPKPKVLITFYGPKYFSLKF